MKHRWYPGRTVEISMLCCEVSTKTVVFWRKILEGSSSTGTWDLHLSRISSTLRFAMRRSKSYIHSRKMFCIIHAFALFQYSHPMVSERDIFGASRSGVLPDDPEKNLVAAVHISVKRNSDVFLVLHTSFHFPCRLKVVCLIVNRKINYMPNATEQSQHATLTCI